MNSVKSAGDYILNPMNYWGSAQCFGYIPINPSHVLANYHVKHSLADKEA